jgi:phosphoglycerate dehydrogenase-like enzyme
MADRHGRVPVLVAFPPDPAPELVARLTGAAPSVDVVACAYEEDHGRRTARGRNDEAGLAQHPAPDLSDRQRAAFARAEVMLAFDLPSELTTVAPNLRWVQAIGAGIDHFNGAGLDARTVVTNAAGVAAVPIAEFVIGRLLAVWKRFDTLADQQVRRVWKPAYGRQLAGCTIGLVGLGAIGTAVAQRARALGMHVLAVRRTTTASPDADEVFTPTQLREVLARSDAVVLSAPSTRETENLFDAAAFSAMKRGAVFCNVARGALVDEDALVAALERGLLGSAILDVTKREPLPADSPLWTAPNLYLSPHSSASPERYLESLFDLFADNLDRYVRGEPLRNVVDLTAGY